MTSSPLPTAVQYGNPCHPYSHNDVQAPVVMMQAVWQWQRLAHAEPHHPIGQAVSKQHSIILRNSSRRSRNLKGPFRFDTTYTVKVSNLRHLKH